MAYQYVFEEGLQISLVPVEESAPLTAGGAKVLELGLNGFTGRIIVTKQASQQSSPGRFTLKSRRNNDFTTDNSSSSSSASEDIRQPSRAAFTRQTPPSSFPPKELKASSLRQKNRQDPPSKVGIEDDTYSARKADISADQRYRDTGYKQLPSSPGASVRQPTKYASNGELQLSQKRVRTVSEGRERSTAQRVGGRSLSEPAGERGGNRRDRPRGRSKTPKNEKNLDYLATAFVSKPKRNREMMNVEDTSIHGSSVEISSVEDASESTPVTKTTEATAARGETVAKQSTPTATSSGGKRDEFASAFVKLSGPSSKIKAEDAASIDEQSASSVSQNEEPEKEPVNKTQLSNKGASPASSRTQINVERPQSTSEDPLQQFTTALSSLSEKHKKTTLPKPIDTIDEGSSSSVSEDTINGEGRLLPDRRSSFSTRGKFKDKPEEEETNSKRRSHIVPRMSWVARAPEPPAGASSDERSPTQEERKTSTDVATTKRKGTQSRLAPERRQEIRDMFPGYPDNRIGENGSLDPVGAFLRRKCAEPLEGTIHTKDLAEMLEVFPYSAFCVDDKGRLPIHILADNGVLLKDQNGRKRAGKLARLLIQAYPESVTCPDSFGRIPFVALIERWVAAQSIRKGEETKEPPSLLWPQAEWCLSMMSKLLDDMIGKGMLEATFERLSWGDRLAARHQYVLALLHCVPDLLKTVLLLGGGAGKVRKRVENMSITRRALLCPESLGKWLQSIVRKYGTSSEIAIDYFVLLSQTKPEDFIGPKRKPSHHDVEAFYDEREKVYRAIEHLKVTIPKEEVERRSSEGSSRR